MTTLPTELSTGTVDNWAGRRINAVFGFRDKVNPKLM
jgi:hypothetical protein